MNISYLIQIAQNKITMLNNAKSQAFSSGDLDQVNTIEKELLDTQNTFSQLTMLADMTQAAANANTTPAAVVASGLEAIQNQNQIQQETPANNSSIINGYDIADYATDPLHEQNIQTIINSMPSLIVASDINNYIQGLNPGSPVTGDMVIAAAAQYNVDIPLLVAIMQNDSGFGMLGVGARTNNPGNVGNTGSEERSYPTWAEGVAAVAEWLSRHRQIQP